MEDKKNNQVMYESELGIMSTLDKSQQRTIIRAIGVGGGGIHAVNHMYLQGIEGVTFVVLDTDCHLLDASPVPNRVLLRSDTTRRSAAEESESEIAALYDDDTKLVIIIAGMGGETGTDVAPVVEELSKHVDALFVIDNQRLTELHKDLDRTNAFAKSDETLSTAARSLCDLITVKNKICLDFNDVNYTLRKGGNAFIVSGFGWGESRVTKALQNALESPLLKGCDVFSSQKILMNFYYNSDSEFPLLMEEMIEIQEFMKNFDEEVDVIWGMSFDNKLVDQIKVTILATGFNVSYSLPMGPKHES